METWKQMKKSDYNSNSLHRYTLVLLQVLCLVCDFVLMSYELGYECISNWTPAHLLPLSQLSAEIRYDDARWQDGRHCASYYHNADSCLVLSDPLGMVKGMTYNDSAMPAGINLVFTKKLCEHFMELQRIQHNW